MVKPEHPNRFMIDEEYQQEVIERDIVVVIEILTDLLDDLQSVEDLSKVKKIELLHNQTVFAEAIVSIGKFLVAINYNIELLTKGVEVLMKRAEPIEEVIEEEIKEEKKDEYDGTYI